MSEFVHGDGFRERWHTLSLAEQLGNVGSEVSRALKWRSRNPEISRRALERALELIDLTREGPALRSSVARLREIGRIRETSLEFFLGDNRHGWTEVALMKYFDGFARAAARAKS